MLLARSAKCATVPLYYITLDGLGELHRLHYHAIINIIACTAGSIKWDLQISKIRWAGRAAQTPLPFNISLYWLYKMGPSDQ